MTATDNLKFIKLQPENTASVFLKMNENSENFRVPQSIKQSINQSLANLSKIQKHNKSINQCINGAVKRAYHKSFYTKRRGKSTWIQGSLKIPDLDFSAKKILLKELADEI
jgi:hypothetical protein